MLMRERQGKNKFSRLTSSKYCCFKKKGASIQLLPLVKQINTQKSSPGCWFKITTLSCDFVNYVFSAVYQYFLSTPEKQLKGLISLEETMPKIDDASQFWNTNKMSNNCIFCFIEGISIIVKNQQRKIQQIEGKFAGTLQKQFKQNSRFFSFWTTKCLKLQRCELKCCGGTWYKIWWKKNSPQMNWNWVIRSWWAWVLLPFSK